VAIIAAQLLVFPVTVAAQDFESLVEDALRRQRSGQEPGPEQVVPPAAPGQLPGDESPGAPPPAGQPLNPVELGPRPYTPPAVEKPAEAPPGGAVSSPADTPSQDAVPTPGAPPVATSGEERTRESLGAEEVNAALFDEAALAVRGANPVVLKAQVLLDRAGASPGAIDAFAGGNLAKAVAAVETVLGVAVDGVLDRQVWDTLRGDATTDVLVQYTLTAEDLSYPFVPVIPEDYAEQARMASLGYSGPQEMLAERFHMDPKLLAALNPEADFRAGSMVWVASVDAQPVTGKISRIVADKGRSQVRAYDSENRLIVAYPATIGSADTPSPTGDHAVESVAPNPVYYYDPANFVQGNNIEKLELPPGPNNPVGSTWIDLSDPGYGIHGTPDPTKIGKTASHGCVRLTNWDVEELAGMVEPGVIVSFVD
jgi:lipoprotein-anchoring transpeptidase ErfK/SrfK